MKEMESPYKTDFEKTNGLTTPTYNDFSADDFKDIASTLASSVTKEWQSQSTLAYASDVKKLTNTLNKIPVTITALQEKCKVLFQYRDELFSLNENISMYNYYAGKYNIEEAKLAEQAETEGEN